LHSVHSLLRLTFFLQLPGMSYKIIVPIIFYKIVITNMLWQYNTIFLLYVGYKKTVHTFHIIRLTLVLVFTFVPNICLHTDLNCVKCKGVRCVYMLCFSYRTKVHTSQDYCHVYTCCPPAWVLVVKYAQLKLCLHFYKCNFLTCLIHNTFW
jgi:hypothetical protein